MKEKIKSILIIILILFSSIVIIKFFLINSEYKELSNNYNLLKTEKDYYSNNLKNSEKTILNNSILLENIEKDFNNISNELLFCKNELIKTKRTKEELEKNSISMKYINERYNISNTHELYNELKRLEEFYSFGNYNYLKTTLKINSLMDSYRDFDPNIIKIIDNNNKKFKYVCYQESPKIGFNNYNKTYSCEEN